jgi:hypothetical protein
VLYVITSSRLEVMERSSGSATGDRSGHAELRLSMSYFIATT